MNNDDLYAQMGELPKAQQAVLLGVVLAGLYRDDETCNWLSAHCIAVAERIEAAQDMIACLNAENPKDQEN